MYIKKINAGYNFYRNREYNQKFELLLLIDVDKLCLTTIKLNSENNLYRILDILAYQLIIKILVYGRLVNILPSNFTNNS